MKKIIENNNSFLLGMIVALIVRGFFVDLRYGRIVLFVTNIIFVLIIGIIIILIYDKLKVKFKS